MTKEYIKNVLKEHAEANMPPDPDLWPRISSRLQDTPTNPQANRYHSSGSPRRFLLAGSLGVLAMLTLFFVMLDQASPMSMIVKQSDAQIVPVSPQSGSSSQDNMVMADATATTGAAADLFVDPIFVDPSVNGKPLPSGLVGQATAAASQPTAAASQYQGTVLPVPNQPLDQPLAVPTLQPVAPPSYQSPTTQTTPPPINSFVETSQDHLSTFALDVDTGSYTAARNYIQSGTLPPYDIIRAEEFVNYFHYDYPVPEDSAFGIYVDGAPSPFAPPEMQPGGRPASQIVRVGIQGRRISDAQRKDAILTFVIDVSGSMAEPNRLPLVKQALRLLVNELRPTDQVGIVIYGSTASIVLEHTSAAQRDKILQAIDSLENDGSTNAEEGLRMGYQLASKDLNPNAINRVILCSDGLANVGETSPEGIRQKIRDYTKQGILLTTVGFGMGDYNDHLMEQLADDGDGNYAYVDTLKAAQRIFVENLTGTLQVIAKDAKVQVDFNPTIVSRYRLIGYENRDVADADFRNDTVDAGEIGAGHTVTALYEIQTTGATDGPALTVQMRYADPNTGIVTELRQPFDVDKLAPDLASATPRFQLAVAAAAFAEKLRNSPAAVRTSLSDVQAIAQRIAPQLSKDQDVQEFLQLVTKAAQISHTGP